MNYGDAVRYWARWRPDELSLIVGEERLAWWEVDRRTDSLAAGLQQLGLEFGDRVGIHARNSLAWCLTTLASVKAGLIVVPINDRFAPTEVAEIVAHAGCSAVLTDDELRPKLDPAKRDNPGLNVLHTGTPAPGDVEYAALFAPPSDFAAPAVGPDDVAVIAYTSGTIGLPKGAMLTHGGILAQAKDRALTNCWTPDNLRTLLCVPMAVTGGIISNFSMTIVAGGRFYLEQTYDPPRVLQLLRDERISSLMGVPVMFDGLTHVPGFDEADLSALSHALVGGAAVPMPLLETFHRKGVRIHQSYGLTEATAFVCDLPARLALERPDCAGLPGMHTRVRILDDERTELPAGEVGEIVVSGPSVMKGYWRDFQSTDTALVDGELHTGDLGYLDKDGYLYVVDRKKDMYISGGFNVYPAEVERVLAELDGIAEAAVVAVPHERWGETGAAIVRAAETVTAEHVVEHCKRYLAGYKVPKYVVLSREELPRNLSGKLLRRDMREQYRDLPQTMQPLA